MDKTRIYICMALLTSVMLLSSCNERSRKSETRTRLQLEYTDPRQAETSGLRFNHGTKKDEEALAYERLAEEWNRNLILGQRPYNGYDSGMLPDHMK